MLKKLRALDHISLKWTIPKCSIFSFTFLKFVAVTAPNTTYAPTSKKYVTAQSIVFHIHKNCSSEYWGTPLYLVLKSTGVHKFLSRRPTFGHAKNGCSKPNCTSNRDTTRKITFGFYHLNRTCGFYVLF